MSNQGSSAKHRSPNELVDTPWLLRHRVEVPDPVPGYVDRPSLEERCAAMTSRIVLLQAPGGFGKTVLLAQCCRRLRAQGVKVAWLSLDEDDSPEALAGYLSLAFKNTGLDTASPRTTHDDARGAAKPRPSGDTRAGYRIDLLIRAIERLETACFLGLDEVERLTNPEAVVVLNRLVRAAPPNLYLAMAFRDVPPGLDIAMLLLDGAATVVKTDDLRFSRAEVARFFDSKLSRRELAAVAEKSQGWPIALRIHHNAGRLDRSPDIVGTDAAAVWIESRLWRGLSAADRDFVLDIALFDRLDPDLIDEATGTLNSRRRLEVMGALAGLLQTSGGAESAMRLHPLIRDHCANRRFAEDPARFRTIHRAIARSLAERGQVVAALRHAAEAGDSVLIGRIAMEAGGIRLWIQRGFGALRTMDHYLTADIVAAYPRLALVRCLVLAISGNVGEANRVFNAMADASTDAARVDAKGWDDPAWAFDRLLVHGMLDLISCVPLTDHLAFEERLRSLGYPLDMDPTARGIVKTHKSLLGNAMARFDEALEWSDRARADLGRTTRYLSPHVDYQAGLACMALGRTQDAARFYDRGLDDARKRRLGDTSTVLFGEILAAELALERTAGTPVLRPPPTSVLGECGAWIDVYAAATEVAAELALHEQGLDGALDVVDDAREYARHTERFPLVRLLCGLRVSLLVAGGRHDEAERTWRAADLPADETDCLDLDSLLWREAEAMAGARLDLFIAGRDYERARALAARLLDIAERRGMTRTLMRTLAAAVRLETGVSDTTRAMGHLSRFLALYVTADYARPLVREREVAMPLLDRVASGDNGGTAIVAQRLRNVIVDAGVERPRPDASPALTREEREILDRIARQTDTEIARGMGMTYDALRYRVRRLFSKLDARSRHDAAHKARALGILPPADSA